MARECGSCSKCCEGWLGANIHGRQMYKGNPCFFIDKEHSNCSIYNNRPPLCQGFLCAWMMEEDLFPNWMKPNVINQIILRKVFPEYICYELVEAGEKVSVEVLNYLIHLAISGKINLQYELHNMPYHIGSKEFSTIHPTRKNALGIQTKEEWDAAFGEAKAG